MNDIEILHQIPTLRIMIIGDVMLDEYLFGNVTRISPEAPVPVVDVLSRESRLGGAANVALNIAALGASPILCSYVGCDAKAPVFLDLMKRKGLWTEGILQSPSRPTTTKLRILGNLCQIVRIDEERTDRLSIEEEDRFTALIEKTIEKEKPGAILFQDYDKGCITPTVIERVVLLAKRYNIPISVDPKKRNFLNFKGVTLFKPNLKELREGLQIDLKEVSENSLKEAVEELHSTLEIDNILITLSEKGAFLSSRSHSGNHQTYLVPAHQRTISDVSGAGDTVISVATICLALGINAKETLEYANLAGGIVCESVGVVPIDKRRFFREITLLRTPKNEQ